MKRNLFQMVTAALIALATVVSVASCKSKEPSGLVAGIDVSAVTPSFSSVTFTVKAEPAKAVAYICLPQGQTMTAAEIFDKGTTVSKSSGTFTYQNLKASTQYTLFVAKLDKMTEGPSWVNFETTENGGAPATSKSAGIRVESFDKGNVKFEIINGDEADYSLVGVWPAVYMENFIFEIEKTGVTRDKYLTDLILGYPYLCATTVGRGKSAMIDYSKDYPNAADSKLWPAAEYMIISLGMMGHDSLGKDGEPGHITVQKFRTDGYELQGAPSVRIDTMYTDYIKIRYKFTPNTDAACFAMYAAPKPEFDEFVSHYDAELGAGQGVAKLQEFVRFADPFIVDHTGVFEFTLTAGFEKENIDFEMIAVPMDRNLMPGEMTRNVNQVRPTPKDQIDAEFEFKVDADNYGVGASNFWYTIKYGANCANVYWRKTNQAAYDAKLKELGPVGYARDLWMQGWGEDRPSNPAQDQTFVETQFHFFGPADAAPGQDHIIVAVAKNYTGGLTTPKIVSTFTTASIKYDQNYAPGMMIKALESGKTQVKFNYKVENQDQKAEHVPRILRHIIFEDGDPFLKLSDREFAEMLYGGRQLDKDSPVVAGNEWVCYSNDDADKGHEYDWNYTWTGMKAGTKYHYVWMTEDQHGSFSKLERITFSTARNDGGPKPAIAIAVDKASIGLNPSDSKQYTCTAEFTPNADSKEYRILFIDRYALMSYNYNDDTKENLEKGLGDLLMDKGLAGYVDKAKVEVTTMAVGHKAWAVAVSFGAAQVKSDMVYIPFDEKGNVGAPITSPIKISTPSYFYRQSSPMRGIEELKARSARARATDTDVKVLPPFSVGEIQAYEAMKAQKIEVNVKSMKEISFEMITRSKFKK